MKVLALCSVPFAVLCVLADQSRYTYLTKLASSVIRYQGLSTSSTPLVNRVARIGSIPYDRLQGANTKLIGGFAAMKDVVALLPQGLLKRPDEALYQTEFLLRLIYLRESKESEPRPWLTNYMYDPSSLDTICDFLQRPDIDHNKILTDFRDLLLAHDRDVTSAFAMSPFTTLRGFQGDALTFYDHAH